MDVDQSILPDGTKVDDISDYILTNFIHETQVQTYLVPVNSVYHEERLKCNQNFMLHISEYYHCNEGLELIRTGTKDAFETWAEKYPESAAVISIIWQCEKISPFDQPAWWPYQADTMKVQILRPGLVYGTLMIKLILDIDCKALVMKKSKK